jgi:hypothetical protein
VFKKNVLPTWGNSAVYPSDNFFPADYDAVQFENFAGGDYRLASGSPYKSGGTDGKDIGANIDEILAAQVADSPPPQPLQRLMAIA